MHRIPRSRRLVIALVMVGLLASGTGLASAAPPAAATLLAPSGPISGSTFAFTWEGVADATFYYLQVNDATASPRFTLWYPASMACPGGSATCSITLTTGWGAGAGIWWVQTWNADGYGPWSVGMPFTVAFATSAWAHTLAQGRFQLVLGGSAVLDREAGLVWQRTPSMGVSTWGSMYEVCPDSFTGGRGGWRLPAVEELTTIVDRSQVNPALPPGHPFGNVGPSTMMAATTFWTASNSAFTANNVEALAVDISTGAVLGMARSLFRRAWCVRGGTGADGLQ